MSIQTYGDLNQIAKMARCRSAGGLIDLLLESVRPYGVSTYAMWATVNPAQADPLLSMLSNSPEEWTQIYKCNRKHLHVPIVQEIAKEPGNIFDQDITAYTGVVSNELFKHARQYAAIDYLTASPHPEWPVVTVLGLSGRRLESGELEESQISLIEHTFMARSMYLRSMEIIPAMAALSDQERHILSSAAKGATDISLADSLAISPCRMVAYWRALCEKLGARDRTQSVSIALWSGEITLS